MRTVQANVLSSFARPCCAGAAEPEVMSSSRRWVNCCCAHFPTGYNETLGALKSSLNRLSNQIGLVKWLNSSSVCRWCAEKSLEIWGGYEMRNFCFLFKNIHLNDEHFLSVEHLFTGSCQMLFTHRSPLLFWNNSQQDTACVSDAISSACGQVDHTLFLYLHPRSHHPVWNDSTNESFTSFALHAFTRISRMTC